MTISCAARRRVLSGLLTAIGLAGAHATHAVSPPRPAEFDICQGCHGVNAQGNAELGAPRIAGLDARYIGRQLTDFRDGRRGVRDAFGKQMIAVASMLDETTIGRLSAYVSSMPEIEASRTLGGDLEAGKSLFGICAACHGANGEGNAGLAAPRLSGMSDWYLMRQFAAFASGRRGATVGDERGAAMRSIAASLTSEQSVRDVIAYAASLQQAAVQSAACAEAACGSSR